jgi:MoaA/NifB/PqqE/SkfB family radical SAM enzyme
LVLPAELASRHGFAPGSPVRIDEEENGFHLHRPISRLAKIYIEPSGQCNLSCRTCVRNLWDEPMGLMSTAVFHRIICALEALGTPPTVFFGGFGEPLFHPQIAEMVSQVKALGCRAELITNGTLLTPERSRALIEAGLDLLWVSLDGATPESYEDVRLGAELPKVIQNIHDFCEAREPSHLPTPEIGIAFVAMKRNINDLPDLLRLSTRLGAARYFVTNLLPYSQEMCSEILYHRVLHEIPYIPSKWVPHLDLPRMDANKDTQEIRDKILRGVYNLSYNGDNLGRANDRCPFIERGATVVAWDGSLSPCLPLSHDHESYMNNRPRSSRRYVIGNLVTQSLEELWGQPEYVDFRQRVQEFDFSPCTLCGGCDLSEANEEDCFGNTFPTCGGCLWAQGVIQCP